MEQKSLKQLVINIIVAVLSAIVTFLTSCTLNL